MPSFVLMLWIWFMMIMMFMSHGPTPNGPRFGTWHGERFLTWRWSDRWIWPWEGMSSSISAKKAITEEMRIRGKWWWPLLSAWGLQISLSLSKKERRREGEEKPVEARKRKERIAAGRVDPHIILALAKRHLCPFKWQIDSTKWLTSEPQIVLSQEQQFFEVKLLFQHTEREKNWDLWRKLNFYEMMIISLVRVNWRNEGLPIIKWTWVEYESCWTSESKTTIL